MIRGVILDGDGTILDSMGIWKNFARDCLMELKIEDPDFPQEQIEDASLKEAAQIFIDHYRLDQSVEEMLEFFQERLRWIYAHSVELLPGAAKFLAELEERKIPCMIATAGDEVCVRSVLRRYGLEPTCDGVFDCTSVRIGKTDPAIYDLARRNMHLTKEEVMVFEDALYALQCASENGYPCIAICSEYDPEYEEKSACALWTMPDYKDMDRFWKLCEEPEEDRSTR